MPFCSGYPFAKSKMAEEIDEVALAELKKKRTFRKYSYRGVDLDQLLDLSRYVFINISRVVSLVSQT